MANYATPDLMTATIYNSKVDFSPLGKLIDDAEKRRRLEKEYALQQERMGMDQTRLGFEQERLGFERAREPFQLRALETAAKLGEENLAYLPRQRELDANYKRAQTQQAIQHGNYYDTMGRVAERRADTGDQRANTQRQKVYFDLLQRIGVKPTPEVWARENQPGGLLFEAFGGPQPWEQKDAILRKIQFAAKGTPDEIDLVESGFDHLTIMRMRRSRQMEAIYGKPKPGFIWDYDERMQPFQKPVADPDTAGERNSQVIANVGIKNLDDAERILNKSNIFERMLGDRWSIPGTSSARNPEGTQIGGYGEAGRGFRAARMAILELNFALSGKSVSNAERQEFMNLYMPSATDSADSRKFKINKMREYFAAVIDARKRGMKDDQIGELYRSFLNPQQQPQRGPQPAPQRPGQSPDGWGARKLD